VTSPYVADLNRHAYRDTSDIPEHVDLAVFRLRHRDESDTLFLTTNIERMVFGDTAKPYSPWQARCGPEPNKPAARGQHPGLPVGDLVRVSIELLGQFGQRLLACQSNPSQHCLGGRSVVPANSFRHVVGGFGLRVQAGIPVTKSSVGGRVRVSNKATLTGVAIGTLH
jgi:hypothetical protein